MPPRIDLFLVGQRRQVLAPSPRVNITGPLPAARMAAKYETRGPHRRRILLFGRTGVSPAVACTEGSDPNLTNTREEVGLVTRIESPPPLSRTLDEIVLDAMVTVATGLNGLVAPLDKVSSLSKLADMLNYNRTLVRSVRGGRDGSRVCCCIRRGAEAAHPVPRLSDNLLQAVDRLPRYHGYAIHHRDD
jgi:hypothetical protein